MLKHLYFKGTQKLDSIYRIIILKPYINFMFIRPKYTLYILHAYTQCLNWNKLEKRCKRVKQMCVPEELNVLLICGDLQRSWRPIKKN